MKDGVAGRTVRITESAITKVVTWCSACGQMPYRDVLIKRFGSVPNGMEDLPRLNMKVFLYNPDNPPGVHEIETKSCVMTENGPSFAPCLANVLELDIDGQFYVVAIQGFTERDYEEVGDP